MPKVDEQEKMVSLDKVLEIIENRRSLKAQQSVYWADACDFIASDVRALAEADGKT